MKTLFTALSLLLIMLLIACNEPVPSITTPPSLSSKINVDSLAQVKADSLIKVKLGNVSLASSYNRPDDNNIFISGNNLKDEVYILPGMIMQIRKSANGKYRLEETGHYVKKSNAKLDTKVIFDVPFFKSFIDRSFSSDIETMSSVAANLSINDISAVVYKTIQVNKLTSDDLDLDKAERIITRLSQNADSTIYGYFIVRSANLNVFTYNKYTKLTGNAQANGLAFQTGANVFSENGTEQNQFEIVLKGISRDKTYLKFNRPPAIEVNEADTVQVAALVRIPKWTEFSTPVEISSKKH